MEYQISGGWTATDDDGWLLIIILFAALSAGIVYQLQQNKKQQYIYSLPWTKKDIYQKSLTKLHISLLFAEIIYGIFFAMKIATIPNAESITNVIICSNLFCILCTDTGFIDRDSIYLARTCHSSRYILCDIADDPSESGIFTPVAV